MPKYFLAGLLVLLVLLICGCTTTVTPSGVRLYGFFDPTCPCCVKHRPGFERVERRFGDRVSIKTFDVTEPDGARLADSYRLEQVPAFIIIDRNGKVIGRLCGGVPANTLERFISRNISKCR